MAAIKDIHQLLLDKKISVTELIKLVLSNIEKANGEFNAFVGTFQEFAMKRANDCDQRIANGESVPVGMGVPIGIKDNMCLESELVTCASEILAGYRSPYTSTAVQKLIDSGYIPIGRTNMDEFAMGSSNEHSIYGPVSNPWDLDRVSGGSSGGSAAAVASGMVPVTLGSDTGGSIRQPASFCGVVGLKPTYGRVSRYGLVAFASSLDQIGPFAQNVEDLAYILESISGFDSHDSTSEDCEVSRFSDHLNIDSLKGKTIGIPNQLMSDAIDSDIRIAIEHSLKSLESLGASIEYFDFPFIDEALSTYYIIAPAEVSSNLSRFDGVRYGNRNSDASYLKEMIQTSRQQGFGDEVKRRIILGTYVLSSGYYDAYYGKAQQVRAVISEKFSNILKSYDFICSPTAPTTAFKKGENMNDPMQMYLSDIATIPVNLAGLPALSIPCGVDGNGYPIGLQMIGSWFKELDLLQAAHLLEKTIQFKPKNRFDLEGFLNAV